MILDATAGNRTLWRTKNHEEIVYIDIEKELAVKPSAYADYRQLPFRDAVFSSIFYDPPHKWGTHSGWYSCKSTEDYKNKYPEAYAKYENRAPNHFTYYGWDKYETRGQLVASIVRAEQEFQRVLSRDGVLWFKWNTTSIPIQNIQAVFKAWTEMLQLRTQSNTRMNSGKNQSETYWLAFMREN